jgi:hypothetical protein
MNINPEIREVVLKIEDHANQYPDDELGNENLLLSLYDHMEPFKEVMDLTTEVEMDYLCNQYPGFYRFGKLLEDIALGVSDDVIAE